MLVVVELLDVVVVAEDWQTEILTVVLPGTCVPAAGFWLSTVPGWALLLQVVSDVWLATRPAPVIADTALDAL